MPSFLTIARLVDQKAIDRLIQVHSRLIEEGYFHKMYIIGDGPLEGMLKQMIKEKQVERTFILWGKRTNPYPDIKACNYFCLLSYYEGLGITILEAKALGKDILITDTAAREAVKDYPKAQIFENTEEGVYKGIKEVLQNRNKEAKEIGEIKDSNEEILQEIKEILN